MESSNSNQRIKFIRSNCIYTKCYCEENVYQLCLNAQSQVSTQHLEYCFAVFISNPAKSVPIWEQKSSLRSDGLEVWDYHVIFIEQHEAKQTNTSPSVVYDMDSRLGFPCVFEE